MSNIWHDISPKRITAENFVCVIEISKHDSLSMHSYLSSVRAGGEEFDQMHREYMKKYTLKKNEA